MLEQILVASVYIVMIIWGLAVVIKGEADKNNRRKK